MEKTTQGEGRGTWAHSERLGIWEANHRGSGTGKEKAAPTRGKGGGAATGDITGFETSCPKKKLAEKDVERAVTKGKGEKKKRKRRRKNENEKI